VTKNTRRSLLASAALVAAMAALVACSSSSSSPAQSSDGGPAAEGGGSPPPPPAAIHESAAPGCHDAPAVVANATATGVGDPRPTTPETGGTIADGVYELKTWTIYEAQASSQGTSTITLTAYVQGTKWYFVYQPDSRTLHETRTVATSGTTITFTNTCSSCTNPSACDPIIVGAYDFTAKPDGLELRAQQKDRVGINVMVFTRS
jgi:hypothetical protein